MDQVIKKIQLAVVDSNKIKKALSILKRKGFFALMRDLIILFFKKIFSQNQDKKIFQRYDLNKIFYNLHQDGLDISPDSYPGKNIYVLSDINIPKKTLKYLGKLIDNLDNFSNEDIKLGVFYVCFKFDEDALPLIKKIKDNNGIFIPHLSTVKTPYRFTNKLAYNALLKSWHKKNRASHLRMDIHENICEALDLTKNIEGDYLEIGVYLGGSALTALNYLDEIASNKKNNFIKKEAFLLDTFDGFNYEGALKSSDAIWKETHKLFGVEKTKSFISETFNDVDTRYHLVENNISKDEIPSIIKKVSVANIDVDLYEPTIDALLKVAPLISEGGIIIVEDALSTPKLYGAYLAMNEFLETEKGKNFIPIHKIGQYFLMRKN